RRGHARDRPRGCGRRAARRRGGGAGSVRGPARYAHRLMTTWRDQLGSDLRPGDVGREVTLAGWVARRRDLGGLVFVDLRDQGGVVQVVINPDTAPAAAGTAHQLRNEFVIRTRGAVVQRAAETVNAA